MRLVRSPRAARSRAPAVSARCALLAVVLAASGARAAEEGPSPPAVEEPAQAIPLEPRAAPEPDATPEGGPPRAPVPKPDARPPTGEARSAEMSRASCGGWTCGLCGAPPAFGAAVGAGAWGCLSLATAGAAPGAFAVALTPTAALLGVAAPSLVALGPCASIGATAGATMGAFSDRREPWPLAIGGLPGIAAGISSSALVVVAAISLARRLDPTPLSAEEDRVNREVVLALGVPGAALALLAGPLSWGGALLADALFGADLQPIDAGEAPPPDGALRAERARDPRDRPTRSRALDDVMAY